MEKSAKIFVAGHNGMVGSAILNRLKSMGYTNFVLRTRGELNLMNQSDVEHFFNAEKPEYVFLAAAKVGGILANSTYPADFLYENLMIQNNVIHYSYLNNVKKLMFLGSSCIYPKFATQPILESELLTGELEPTNEGYALAKIAGIKMCDYYRKQYGCNFISVMPTNLYGLGDNFDANSSHVIPAMINKFHKAKSEKQKEVTLWGSGSPLREFLHADDMAAATIFCMLNYNQSGHVNVGSQSEISIKNLAEMIGTIVGFEGETVWDSTKPDGTPRKLMDSTKLYNMGWSASIELRDGLEAVYENYKSQL